MRLVTNTAQQNATFHRQVFLIVFAETVRHNRLWHEQMQTVIQQQQQTERQTE